MEDFDTEVKGLSLQENEDKSREALSINLPPLCVVCGCGGPKKCSCCHLKLLLPVIHWKSGHKRLCREETCAIANFGQTFEEFEVVTEPEPSIQSSPEKSEAERMKEYHQFLELQSSRKSGTFNVDQASMDDMEKGMKRDKQFMIFRKRISLEPDQVISVEDNGMHTVCVCVRAIVLLTPNITFAHNKNATTFIILAPKINSHGDYSNLATTHCTKTMFIPLIFCMLTHVG